MKVLSDSPDTIRAAEQDPLHSQQRVVADRLQRDGNSVASGFQLDSLVGQFGEGQTKSATGHVGPQWLIQLFGGKIFKGCAGR
jgi:hypothetical protein